MAYDHDRAFAAESQIGRINTFFPLLPRLGNRWAASRPWEGLTLGVNMHLTTLTAALLRELALGGGTFVVSACNPATTDKGTVELLRNLGMEVYTGGDGKDRYQQVLHHNPDLLVDVGFELIEAALHNPQGIRGAIEVTRSGITKLRAAGEVPFPVVNINDGRLKDAIENRHGVGEAIWSAVGRLTGMHLAGRRCVVVGYGPVGKGLAAYGRSAGMAVDVVEADPIRRLFAHYDGYPTPSLTRALNTAGIVVTATGRSGSITVDALANARDGVVLLNAGHGGDEIDISAIARVADKVDNIAKQVVRYRIEDGPRVTVLADGHPLNIVLNNGSPEPILLHFAVLGLSLEQLALQGSGRGEVPVPEELEAEAALLALECLLPEGSQ